MSRIGVLVLPLALACAPSFGEDGHPPPVDEWEDAVDGFVTATCFCPTSRSTTSPSHRASALRRNWLSLTAMQW